MCVWHVRALELDAQLPEGFLHRGLNLFSLLLCLSRVCLFCACAQELDEQLYEECRQRYEQEQRLKRQKEDQRQREWQQMQHRAQKQAQVKGLPNGVVNCSSTYTPILIRSKS